MYKIIIIYLFSCMFLTGCSKTEFEACAEYQEKVVGKEYKNESKKKREELIDYAIQIRCTPK